MKKIVYKNLSANSGHRMMYIRSSHIESKNWEMLLLSFSDEALYFMTLGYKIVIKDKSHYKKGKIERVFCPVMTDFLRTLCKLRPINNNLKYHLESALYAYRTNKNIKKKYDFFKNKLNNPEVQGRTIKVKKEISVFKRN